MLKLPKYPSGGGSYGNYYELSSTVGVKVLHGAEFPTVAKAVASRRFKLAVKEADLLQYAYDSGVVPQCYGVSVVRKGRGYAIGIVMQHLGDRKVSKAQETEAYDIITDALGDLGMKHKDLHRNNILVYRGKFYAVDFDSRYVNIK